MHLLTCFLKFALNLYFSPDSVLGGEPRPCVERIMSSTQIAGRNEVSAEDDGRVCLMGYQNGEWYMKHPFLAILEAKRAFRAVDVNERTGMLTPAVSNQTLAHYLGEELVAWRADPARLENR